MTALQCETEFQVRDHIPLEQGLRHRIRIQGPVSRNVRDHIPLEQGLRLEDCGFDYHDIKLSETIFH